MAQMTTTPSGRPPGALSRFTDGIARLMGSWTFVALHIVWFVLWFVFSLDIGLFTLILSIEAILLATVILMAQNRQVERDETRAQKDLETDMKAEREIREVKVLLKEIRDRLEK